MNDYQKHIVKSEFAKNINSELEIVIQDSLSEFKKTGEDIRMAFMPVSMDVFAWKEFANNEYKKIRFDLGMSESEIETIIDDCIHKVLSKYFQI